MVLDQIVFDQKVCRPKCQSAKWFLPKMPVSKNVCQPNVFDQKVWCSNVCWPKCLLDKCFLNKIYVFSKCLSVKMSVIQNVCQPICLLVKWYLTKMSVGKMVFDQNDRPKCLSVKWFLTQYSSPKMSVGQMDCDQKIWNPKIFFSKKSLCDQMSLQLGRLFKKLFFSSSNKRMSVGSRSAEFDICGQGLLHNAAP